MTLVGKIFLKLTVMNRLPDFCAVIMETTLARLLWPLQKLPFSLPY